MSDNADWSNFLREMSDLGLFGQLAPGCAHRIADALDARDRIINDQALDIAQLQLNNAALHSEMMQERGRAEAAEARERAKDEALRCARPWLTSRETRERARVVEKIDAALAQQPADQPAQHDLYKTGDPDAPEVIKDDNGEVELGLCRRCGRAEIELEEPCDQPAQGKRDAGCRLEPGDGEVLLKINGLPTISLCNDDVKGFGFDLTETAEGAKPQSGFTVRVADQPAQEGERCPFPIVESASGIPSTPERIIIHEPGKVPEVKVPDALTCPEEMVRELFKLRSNDTRIIIARWLGHQFVADDGKQRLSIYDNAIRNLRDGGDT